MSKQTYRVERGTHRTPDGDRAEVGDTVELTESQAARLPAEKFSRVETGSTATATDEEAADEDDEEADELDEESVADGVPTCEAELSSGELCGRERPCQYHD